MHPVTIRTRLLRLSIRWWPMCLLLPPPAQGTALRTLQVKRAIELLSGERGAEEVQITAQERAQQGNDFLTLQKLLQKLEENIKNAPLREVGGKQVRAACHWRTQHQSGVGRLGGGPAPPCCPHGGVA